MRAMHAKRWVLTAIPVALAVAGLASLAAAAGRGPSGAARGSSRAEAAGDRRAGGEAAEIAHLRRRLATSEARLADETAALRAELLAARAKLRALGAEAARAPAGPVPATGDVCAHEAPSDARVATAEDLVAAIETALLEPEPRRAELADGLTERLATLLREDPAALHEVLGKLRASIGTDLAGPLAVALGEVRHPAVEATAIELARSTDSEARRLAGLELLERLDLPSPAAREAVVSVLRGGGAPEVLGSALYALPRGVPAPAETREALSVVVPLTRHADAEVRRRAVIAAADWAPDEGALAPVVSALADPSADVRAGAAHALGRSRATSTLALRALVSRLEDEREDPAVREQAWRALSRYPLDDRAHAAYVAFEASLDAQEEAATAPPPEGDQE